MALFTVVVEQVGLVGGKLMRFTDIIKADDVESAKKFALEEMGVFGPNNIKECRPTVLEDVEKCLRDYAVLSGEEDLRDATPEEMVDLERYDEERFA